MDPEQLKGLGNDCLKKNEFDQALQYYTQAIEIAEKQNKPTHVYFSNRCATYQSTKDYENALKDANSCIESNPQWAKGYLRKGQTLVFLDKFEEAEKAYMDGLKIDPVNTPLQKQYADLKSQMRQQPDGPGPAGSKPAGMPFGDPSAMFAKLQQNPKTKGYLQDPSYMKMLMDLAQNPQNMMKYMQDPRMMETIGVLTGIDMNKMGEEVEQQDKARQENEASCPMSSTTQNDNMDTSEPTKPQEKEPETEEMEVDDNIKLSLEEKAKGTKAYKQKNFDDAHKHYATAFELDPTNMVFLLNTAAVYLEQKNYEKCRETCQKGIEVGRENKGEYKMIAKALARIGTSYEKESNLEDAMFWYNKSVSEFRDKPILMKIKKLEQTKKEQVRKAYFDEDKFLEAKKNGNEAFKAGKYPDAIQFYNDCVKRKDDKDKTNFEDLAIIFSNRAACYHKLMEFNLAIADCKSANKMNPSYFKAYIRLGMAFEATKSTSEAKTAFHEAMQLEPGNKEAQEGFQRCVQKAYESRNDEENIKERVKNDPEIKAILSDPGMRMILEQMQSDPGAIQDHLQNKDIAVKIQKLVDAGIIKIGGKQ